MDDLPDAIEIFSDSNMYEILWEAESSGLLVGGFVLIERPKWSYVKKTVDHDVSILHAKTFLLIQKK